MCMHIVNVCLNYVHEQHRSPSSFFPLSLSLACLLPSQSEDRRSTRPFSSRSKPINTKHFSHQEKKEEEERMKTSNTISVFHRFFDCLMRWIKLLVTLICRV